MARTKEPNGIFEEIKGILIKRRQKLNEQRKV
jgi:hypothetical protein